MKHSSFTWRTVIGTTFVLMSPVSSAALITFTPLSDPAIVFPPIGDIGPLAIGDSISHDFGIVAGPNHFFTGKVLATNAGGKDLTLTLTEFEYKMDVATIGGVFNVSLNIIQDFEIPKNVNYDAQHRFFGNYEFGAIGQFAGIDKISAHENIQLDSLSDDHGYIGGPLELPFAQGPTPVKVIPGVDAYRMDTTFLFHIEGATAANPISINLPLSATDFATTAIPEPSILALIGIGLAGLGFSRIRKD